MVLNGIFGYYYMYLLAFLVVFSQYLKWRFCVVCDPHTLARVCWKWRAERAIQLSHCMSQRNRPINYINDHRSWPEPAINGSQGGRERERKGVLGLTQGVCVGGRGEEVEGRELQHDLVPLPLPPGFSWEGLISKSNAECPHLALDVAYILLQVRSAQLVLSHCVPTDNALLTHTHTHTFLRIHTQMIRRKALPCLQTLGTPHPIAMGTEKLVLF